MERGELACSVQLEDRAEVVCTAALCRAIQASIACLNQLASGEGSLARRATEAAERHQIATGIQAENSSGLDRAAATRDSIDRAVRGLDHPAGMSSAHRHETVEGRKMPSRVHLEDRPGGAHAAA